MPIYPYVCTACGHEFDALQKISDAPLTDCPECGDSGLRKRLAAPAFQLKGTGWYETDFKNSGKKQKDDKEDKQKSDGKEDKKESGSSTDKDQAGSKSESKSSSDKESKSKPAAASGGKD